MDMNEGKVGEKLGRALDDAQLVKYDEWNGTLEALEYFRQELIDAQDGEDA